MSGVDLDRVKQDLATLKDAARLELPFGRKDVRINLWMAACGALIAVWFAMTPWDDRWLRILLFCPPVVFVGRAMLSAKRDRDHEPARWRELRMSLLAMVIIVPLVVAYIRWERWIGMPREMAGAAALFFVGVAALVVALMDFRRLHYAGGALALMAFGIAFPNLSRTGIFVAGGLCIMAGCLASAAVQWWQLREVENGHASD